MCPAHSRTEHSQGRYYSKDRPPLPVVCIGCKCVRARHLNALAGDRADAEAVAGLRRILDAEIGPRAGLDLIVTGELINVEQQGVVEDQALRIRDGHELVIGLAVTRDDLTHRLDHLRNAARLDDKGVAVIEAYPNHVPGERVRLPGDIPFLETRHVVDVAAREHEWGVYLSQIVLKRPPPLHIRRDMLGVALATFGNWGR